MIDLSIIIPAFNERESLEELYGRIREICEAKLFSFEVIFIDDGSTDHTFEAIQHLQAKDRRVRGVRFRINQGKAAGLAMGFARASGKYVITMDADLQDDPAEIPALIAKLEEGFDLVSGWKKKRHDPLTKILPSKLYNLTTSLVSGIRLHDFNCGLKAYRGEVVKGLHPYGQMHRYLPALAHWAGFRVTEKVVEHHPRKHGKTKYGPGRFFHGYLDLLTIAFLHRYMKRPLHFFGLLGSFLCAMGAVVLGYFGVQWIITREMHIRPLVLLSVTSIILGIQFISLGLLGEMITYSGKKELPAVAEEV